MEFDINNHLVIMSNVSYGVCKEAVDRLSKDMAYELKSHKVSVFSLYPGQIRTEGMIIC
ncbi:MAG: SDR family NAD(P)-dependent oxidoreductase [Firmicutes bacterium]|nr:SDR family NAD(P)-dependent oxidoreductase [Bacillota bacterium]